MKGLRIVIIVVGALVVLTAVALVVLRLTAKTNTNSNQPSDSNQVNSGNANAANANANQNTNQPANANSAANDNQNSQVNTNTNATGTTTEANLKAIARSFAERFGTYSNHSNFENIEHLLPYMTESMKDWAEKFLKDSRKKKPDSSVYYGMTTRTMSVKQVSYDSEKGSAEFLVKAQRKESTGTTSNARVFYQDLQIKFIKEQSVWKVNEAWWQ